MARRMSSGFAPAVAANCRVPAAGTVAPLAIDAFGERSGIYGLGKGLFMSGRDCGIGVVAEHAVVGDGAAEVVVIRTVVAGVHGPVAALLGVPGQGQLDQRIGGGTVQIRARVIAGPHDVVDLLLHHVDLLAGGIELVATLKVLPVALEHGEVAVRRLMVEGVLAGEILYGEFRRGAIEGSSHAGAAVGFPYVFMTAGTEGGVAALRADNCRQAGCRQGCGENSCQPPIWSQHHAWPY